MTSRRAWAWLFFFIGIYVAGGLTAALLVLAGVLT